MDPVDSTGAPESSGVAVDLAVPQLPGCGWVTCSTATPVTDLAFLHGTFSLLHTIHAFSLTEILLICFVLGVPNYFQLSVDCKQLS